MNVSVIGAGKMGLPLACQLAANGASVTACDINPSLVEAINEGRCPLDEPGVPELLRPLVAAHQLRATTDTAAAVARSDVAILIVPAVLTVNRAIDPSNLIAASQGIAKGLHPGMMICCETTLPVGGTRRILQPIYETSGLKAGADFDLVFSPERVKSQRVLLHLTQTPKIVGGITPQAAARAAEFYGRYLGAPVINLGTLEAAEFAKLAGMIYRDTNIALANELARYAQEVGVDLGPVIRAANTDGESHLLWPGIGVGGHCTPVYPYFLINDARQRGIPLALPEEGRRINDTQAAYMIARVERLWGSLRGRRAMILGLGFRPQVKEHIYSTAFLLRDALQERGTEVSLHDPLYTEEEIQRHGFTPASLQADPFPELLILNTAHKAYEQLDFRALAARGARVALDGRDAWEPSVVCKAGLMYVGIGRPASPPQP